MERWRENRDGQGWRHKRMRHTQTASSIQDKIEVQIGFREMEEGCQKERRWGLKKGRSVRRCPEIQDVRQQGRKDTEGRGRQHGASGKVKERQARSGRGFEGCGPLKRFQIVNMPTLMHTQLTPP
ncbi:hypothetical protein F7725_023147, partial [Dissostichus mawsoni]